MAEIQIKKIIIILAKPSEVVAPKKHITENINQNTKYVVISAHRI